MNVEITVSGSARDSNGLAKVEIHVPDLAATRELDLSFEDLFKHCRVPDNISLDLLVVASLCYVIDKTVPRSTAFDSWTREFDIEFPVVSPRLWAKASDNLAKSLSFLTGDVWKLRFRKADVPIFVQPSRVRKRKSLPPKLDGIKAICSLSGGTDSLVGAIDLLESKEFSRLHLIGHYDAPGAKKAQDLLFERLRTQFVGSISLTQVRVAHRPRRANESSLRSRSLVFIAMGIYAARAAGEEIPVYMPENGFIALNVPLTPGRAGSCSTRTMHPYYLGLLRRTLDDLQIRNAIINPLELKTKGECISQCANFDLLRTLINNSVSCSHGTRKQQWTRKGKENKNCGYCVPCLIRRAGLHKATLDSGDSYGIDVCAGEITPGDQTNSANDLRAIVNLILDSQSVDELKKTISSVAPVDNLTARAAVIDRGVDEIKALFKDKGSDGLIAAAGLAT
jgi:hypothetical protein